MSSDGRYLAITTSRTQFTLPALQLTGNPAPVPGPQRALRRGPAEPHDRTCRPLDHRWRHRRRTSQDGVTISADGVAGRLQLLRRQPLSRRRQPARRRLRRHARAGTRRRKRGREAAAAGAARSRRSAPGRGYRSRCVEAPRGIAVLSDLRAGRRAASRRSPPPAAPRRQAERRSRRPQDPSRGQGQRPG